MRHLLLFSLLFLSISSFAQTKLYNAQVQVGGGYSTHGTGDMRGIAFFTEYSKPVTKRIDWAVNVMTTIHGDAFTVIVNYPGGLKEDRSFRYNTAGLQAGPKLSYNIVQAQHHQLKIQPGGYVRYQNSSYPNMYAFSMNTNGGTSEPSFSFRHQEKQNIVSVGYSLDLCYNFITGKKIMIGLKAGFQNDTNGDAITQIAVSVGKRF
jgi:hypothetical protein